MQGSGWNWKTEHHGKDLYVCFVLLPPHPKGCCWRLPQRPFSLLPARNRRRSPIRPHRPVGSPTLRELFRFNPPAQTIGARRFRICQLDLGIACSPILMAAPKSRSGKPSCVLALTLTSASSIHRLRASPSASGKDRFTFVPMACGTASRFTSILPAVAPPFRIRESCAWM